IFGLLPLVVADGVGSIGTNTLGAGVVGGMFLGTIALLFLVPVLYIMFESIQEKLTPIKPEDEDE
ncbi:MAG: efflux RND transporter permease subunit, partial [Bacteroidales bacterium]|nr:efflux RND transporter permease subunit [Bacteroidales bacterium]